MYIFYIIANALLFWVLSSHLTGFIAFNVTPYFIFTVCNHFKTNRGIFDELSIFAYFPSLSTRTLVIKEMVGDKKFKVSSRESPGKVTNAIDGLSLFAKPSHAIIIHGNMFRLVINTSARYTV